MFSLEFHLNSLVRNSVHGKYFFHCDNTRTRTGMEVEKISSKSGTKGIYSTFAHQNQFGEFCEKCILHSLPIVSGNRFAAYSEIEEEKLYILCMYIVFIFIYSGTDLNEWLQNE